MNRHLPWFRAVILVGALLISSIEAINIDVRMPGVRPQTNDAYRCRSVDLANVGVAYINEFIPRTSRSAHHILLHSCRSPPPRTSTGAWNCGEMHNTTAAPTFPVCRQGGRIIYAWAMDAPPLNLPPDVSFMVGDEDSRYLVVQVHYRSADSFRRNPQLLDRSGVTARASRTPTSRLAGVYILMTNGVVPPLSRVYMEASCAYTGGVTLNPFAYRTHTHRLGVLVSGYVIKPGTNQWTELGRISPQQPQMFYNVTNRATVDPRDVLAARCIMDNSRDVTVRIGSTSEDEMCNFYVMYWVNRRDAARMPRGDDAMCITDGWPRFRWAYMLDLGGEPITSAMLPGSGVLLNERVSTRAQAAVGELETRILGNGGGVVDTPPLRRRRRRRRSA